jgi:predicted nuclease of predicted toxin-antitoxin system
LKFKLDGNLPVDLAVDLKVAGHDADTVVDEHLSGFEDDTVLAAALAEGRIVFTLDKGIANVVQHPMRTHAGVVLFRPGSDGRKQVLSFIRKRLNDLLACDLANRITIVTEEKIRIR